MSFITDKLGDDDDDDDDDEEEEEEEEEGEGEGEGKQSLTDRASTATGEKKLPWIEPTLYLNRSYPISS